MRRKFLLGVMVLFCVSACGKGNPMSNSGGSGGSGGGTTSSGTMTAQIDGSNWTAPSPTASITNGILAVGGSDAAIRAISFGVLAPGVGTYTINGNPGTNFLLILGSQGFSSSFGVPGASGTIVLTTLTSSRATGTFSFVAGATSGGAVGTRTVTNGAFNLTF